MLREISKDMEQNSEDDPSFYSVAFKTVLLRAAHYVAKTLSSQAMANVFAAVLRNIDYIALFLQLSSFSYSLLMKSSIWLKMSYSNQT